MISVPFATEEFCIEQGKNIPQWVATKLWSYHIIPMIVVRALLGQAIWASQNSGYRPEAYEKAQGRSGNSQHTFKGKGAVDWTCEKKYLDKLLKLILQYTDYTRIAVYDTFIHCDYKAQDGKRYLFESDSKSNWRLIDTLNVES